MNNYKTTNVLLITLIIVIAIVGFIMLRKENRTENVVTQTSSNTEQSTASTDIPSQPNTSANQLQVTQKVSTEFGNITIPQGWKAEASYYRGSISGYALVPNTFTNPVIDRYDDYVSIGGIQATCEQFPSNQGYYCKEGKEGLAIVTKNSNYFSLVNSLQAELK